MLLTPPSGPTNARIMIVGEAPGEAEEGKAPFLGASGQELTRMLADAGIDRGQCFLTNVCRVRPPGNRIEAFFTNAKKMIPGPHIEAGIALLEKEISLVRPNLILALGNTSLWALTRRSGITTWRGSVLDNVLIPGIKVLPTYHPAAVLRMWPWRWTAVQDMRRAAREARTERLAKPAYNFAIRPSFETTIGVLNELKAKLESGPLPLAVDLETRARQIACLGIGWSNLDAICIPFMCVEREGNYWLDEANELSVVALIRTILTHPNARIIGQNFLYDSQYFAHQWGYVPRCEFDTMLAQHLCFPAMPKGLDFIASMYCENYEYWKDEGKEWDRHTPEEQLWGYNCKDAVYTFEAAAQLRKIIDGMGLSSQWQFQMRLFQPVLRMMLRGVRVSQETRNELYNSMSSHVAEREALIHKIAGYELNPRSPKQMKDFFYHQMGVKPIYSKKRNAQGERTLTCDDAALEEISKSQPHLRRLILAIQEMRTLGVNLANVVVKPTDSDGRVRCSYNIGGTVVFRFSSSESAFGTGFNLQNVTTGERSDTGLAMPNLRRLLIPDDECTMIDGDLERADLWIVVWEADDVGLKLALRMNIDFHCMNAAAIFNIKGIPPDELVETHPNYREHRARIGEAKRYYAKQGVHAVNYGCQAPKLAKTLNLTIHEADLFIRGWFGAHPGIVQWHARVADQIARTRTVENRFGFKRFFFERVEEIFPEALAWVPASTVAHVTNEGLIRMEEQHSSYAELLLQVHDSLTIQTPSIFTIPAAIALREAMSVEVPYPDPLTIPVTIKASTKSWGDTKPLKC